MKPITNIKDATEVPFMNALDGKPAIGFKGDSTCVSCGKFMPVCWDTVCSVCGDTSCYECSTGYKFQWYCRKHAPE